MRRDGVEVDELGRGPYLPVCQHNRPKCILRGNHCSFKIKSGGAKHSKQRHDDEIALR